MVLKLKEFIIYRGRVYTFHNPEQSMPVVILIKAQVKYVGSSEDDVIKF